MERVTIHANHTIEFSSRTSDGSSTAVCNLLEIIKESKDYPKYSKYRMIEFSVYVKSCTFKEGGKIRIVDYMSYIVLNRNSSKSLIRGDIPVYSYDVNNDFTRVKYGFRTDPADDVYNNLYLVFPKYFLNK